MACAAATGRDFAGHRTGLGAGRAGGGRMSAALPETVKFCQRILPSANLYFVCGLGNGKFINHACRSAEAAAQKAAEIDAIQHDAYIALAGYKEPHIEVGGKTKQRVAENVICVRAFWLDIDCGAEKAAQGKGYATKKDAAAALKEFCTA